MKRTFLQSAIVLIVMAGLLALAGCDTAMEPDTYLSYHDSTDDLDSVNDVTDGLEGYWRRDNLDFGEEETDEFMYDWYKFSKNGTYHVYHYMDKDRYCADRGEFSYYIDDNNQFISTDKNGKVTTYYGFTKNGDNAFSWKTTSNGSVLGFERFDGETFWHKASSIIAGSSLSLAESLEGYWRRDNATSSSMYDWYEFSKNGTYHVYHYMSNDPYFADRGEFSYYIDDNNQFISTDKNGDNAFSWKTTSNGSALGFERFDGKTFKKESGSSGSGGSGNSGGGGGCCCNEEGDSVEQGTSNGQGTSSEQGTSPGQGTSIEAGNWSLANESNPFIGTWGYSTTSTMGMNRGTTEYELEFKTDSTIVQKTTAPNGSITTSTLYYLIKGSYIVISSTNGSYTKSTFTVNNNKEIKVGSTTYTRVGAENPDADRTFNLINGGLDGYWRSTNITSSSYDWYTFNKNGTCHWYQYKNGNPKDTDKGEFSYYIDWANNRLVTMDKSYNVTTYYYFTKTGDNAFSWKTSNSSSGSALGFERFDGETFNSVENSGSAGNGNGNGNSGGGGCC
jgi:hypothetical protein